MSRPPIASILAIFISWSLCAAADFHVAPNGNDANPGTDAQPFRSLARARDAVREVNTDMASDILVHLAPGEYQLAAPVVFTDRDSGSNGHRVVYRSEIIGGARFTGGVKLTGWTKHKGAVWKVDIDKGCHTLYESGRRARKARLPNYEHDPKHPAARAPYFTSATGTPPDHPKENRTSWITWREGDLDLTATDKLKINIFPWGKRNWHQWICEVTHVDPATRRIEFDNLGDTTMILGHARYFLEDHMRFLDAPGEFFVDKAASVLYYLPRGKDHPDKLNIVMPITKDIIRIEGASPDSPTHHIAFEGLSLGITDATSPTLYWWTHGWGKTDHALVWMQNAEQIRVRRCHLKNSGRSGVMMVGHNLYNEVSGCWIEQMGVNGIAMSNRFPKSKDRGRLEHNVLRNNRIHDVGQLSLYASCVNLINGSYNEVSNCEFYNSPRYAVTLRGNTNGEKQALITSTGMPPATDNVFKYLKVYACGQDSGDMGALHAAGVNIPDGPFVNTFEQITVDNTHAVEGMNDIAPDGIFLDWSDRTMHQVFRNVHITNSHNKQFRSNKNGNAKSAVTQNVSWKPDFDELQIDREAIGLMPSFPKEFGGQGIALKKQNMPTKK